MIDGFWGSFAGLLFFALLLWIGERQDAARDKRQRTAEEAAQRAAAE